MPFTLVSFHAHPDDEALLTGGTLARAAVEGHRVVLVTATDGAAGLASPDAQLALGERRLAELRCSAAALGCARVATLGYPDSGSAPVPVQRPGEPVPFALLDPIGPAEQLAEILLAEQADVLTVYDEVGGYGHPDHVQVHRVGVLAAELAGTRVVLEATVDRDRLRRAADVLRFVPGVARLIPESRFATAYLDRSELTHEVDVRRYLGPKKAALAAHASQSTGAAVRTLSLLLRLPDPLFGRVLGREWFREVGRPTSDVLLDDVFASLRSSGPPGS